MAHYQLVKINPKRFHRSQIKFYLILIPLAVIMLLPVIYIISTAFKPVDELFVYPPRFFVQHPTWDNFQKLFTASDNTTYPLSLYLFNSIVSTWCGYPFGLGISCMAAYVLSKKKFKGKEIVLKMNTLSMMFVGTAVTIPRYLIIQKAGLLDNFLVNIIPFLAMPVGVFLLKQFMDQVPNSLIEAAKIDGATDYCILRKVVLPIVKPALATVSMLLFQAAWNSTEAAYLFLNQEKYKNFAYYVNGLAASGNGVAGRGMAAAGALLIFLPNIVLFVFLQSRVMDTMAHSGIK